MITLKSKFHSKTFQELVPVMESWLEQWDPTANYLPIKDYFGQGMGGKRILKSLHSTKVIQIEQDFKGVYVFLKNGKPFYTGISKHVIHRI